MQVREHNTGHMNENKLIAAENNQLQTAGSYGKASAGLLNAQA